MLDPDEVHEEELSTDEFLDRHFVGPDDGHIPAEATWRDHWDEYPDAQPGDYAWFDDAEEPVLYWKYDDGYQVALTNLDFGDWQATITVPESFGSVGPMAHTIKAQFTPTVGDRQVGYIDEVRMDGHTPEAVVVRCSEAEGMPIVALESLIEEFRETAAENDQFHEQLDACLSAADEYSE